MRTINQALLAAAAALAAASAGAAVVNLTGSYTSDYDYTATEDTTVNLNGVTFTDCTLKLRGDRTFTINLAGRNVFTMSNANKELIKATKNGNIVFAGTGSAELTSTKRITDSGKPSGIVVCNDLTVQGGDIMVTFDQGHTLVTAEGDTLPIPAHYDISPAAGTSTVFTLSLNDLARPVYADPASDGVAAIAVDGDEVTVGVRTREGLSYRLLSATALSTNAVWTPTGDAKAGTGAAIRFSSPVTNDWAFYKVRADD